METVNIDLKQLEARPLSYSSLKQFARSPKHFIHYRTTPFAPSPAMILGSAFEVYAFDNDNFDSKYRVHIPATGTGSQALNREAYAKAR